MEKKMKRVSLILIMYTVIICAQEPPVAEMYSGWCWYPYSSYYYPCPYYGLYDPWYYSSSWSSVYYPYNYSEDTDWYAYNGYPYSYYPFGGICFHNKPVVFELGSKKILDLSNVDNIPPLPGSAPLSLRSTNEVSVQSERLNRFFAEEKAP